MYNCSFLLDKRTIVHIIYVETDTWGNIMTVGEVKNMFKDQYVDVEYYRNTFNCTHQIDFNLEHCTGVNVNEINDDMEAIAYQLELLPTQKLA